MSRLLISAAHKSSGKTTISIGLCAALAARGMKVQPFKKGPDYIDPMWLGHASGRPCFNLDPYLSSSAQIVEAFACRAASADFCLVEGNKGLYDGLALDGSNSNAALAKLLDLPVVLVIDARGMTRGIAPLILGFQAFDKQIRIGGVILNQLGGSRHESKLRAVIEHYTDVQVLGAVGFDKQMEVVERHLGLIPSHEANDANVRIEMIRERVSAQVDLTKIVDLANSAAALPAAATVPPLAQQSTLRIGIARDKAFGFYYPDDLQALEEAGAELVPFDTLTDTQLPMVNGLFIGGGFPEMFMAELAANSALRESLRSAIDAGMPVYAECGGLMYLGRKLIWQGREYDMVGALPFDVRMNERPVGRGYVELQTTADFPWPSADQDAPTATVNLRGHEFHYSSLENVAPDLKFAYTVKRGHGIDGNHDGIVYHNALASYAHLRSGAGSDWANKFVAFIRRCKSSTTVQPTPIRTDAEGYLRNLGDWSEDFVKAQAHSEQLTLQDRHWQVIHFLRNYFDEHRVQAQVRTMIKHFAPLWPDQPALNHYLHELFPVGGPQKQGNRLAGLLKTKGEH
jgi:cobyrinic acid a,c-diamide synthase